MYFFVKKNWKKPTINKRKFKTRMEKNIRRKIVKLLLSAGLVTFAEFATSLKSSVASFSRNGNKEVRASGSLKPKLEARVKLKLMDAEEFFSCSYTLLSYWKQSSILSKNGLYPSCRLSKSRTRPASSTYTGPISFHVYWGPPKEHNACTWA